jgi:hypothetical protein
MYLKKYQQRVVSEIKQFFTTAKTPIDSFNKALKTMPEEMQL